jgi:hypothetical protein
MATIKQYRVIRASFARSKVDGSQVHVTRENEASIPYLLSKADIKARVDSGALEEFDTGIEEGDLEAARALEAESGTEVEVPDTRTVTSRSGRGRAARES